MSLSGVCNEVNWCKCWFSTRWPILDTNVAGLRGNYRGGKALFLGRRFSEETGTWVNEPRKKGALNAEEHHPAGCGPRGSKQAEERLIHSTALGQQLLLLRTSHLQVLWPRDYGLHNGPQVLRLLALATGLLVLRLSDRD